MVAYWFWEDDVGAVGPASEDIDGHRYAAWFHELDAWTEYWDIYHPETKGRFCFGDGDTEPGLLTHFLPRARRPPAFSAWTAMASSPSGRPAFLEEVRVPEVASAIMEIDALIDRLFSKHFGNAADPGIRGDYLEGIFRFASDSLPAATKRDSIIAEDDPRKRTAGRHTLDGDIMWFAWALHTEAAWVIAGLDQGHARRALLLAGVAMGCSVNFAWRGHRRTRPEYRPDAFTANLLRDRGRAWATDFEATAQEVHALYRIREWGSDE